MSDDVPMRLTADGKLVPFTAEDIAQRAADAAAAVPMPVTVTGNQWAFALRDLGLADAWEAALAKSKASDRNRERRIARDTPLVATDPLLIRIAANAGTDSAGVAVISVAAVFAKAQGEPT